jgi:hypothetical protein
MLARIAAILAPNERAALAAAAARARGVAPPTLSAMAERTMKIYQRSMRPAAAGGRAAIAAVRCLEALHYKPWRPAWPLEATPATQANGDVAIDDDTLVRIARAALRIRHTMPGRLLYSLAPKSLVNALKGRLP